MSLNYHLYVENPQMTGQISGLCCAVLNRFSGVQLCVTLWIVAHQAPLSMGLSRQEY